MEEKLKEILDKYEHIIERGEYDTEKLVSKMTFCKEHNFDEEFRISNVAYQASNMLVYRWREMNKEISDALNAWNS